MSRSTRSPHHAAVVQLYAEGLRPRAIVERLGVSSDEVRYAVRKATRYGEVMAHNLNPDVPFKRHAVRARVRLGSLGDLDHELTPAQCQWLIDEVVPTGCDTVREYVAELIRDAHAVATEETSSE